LLHGLPPSRTDTVPSEDQPEWYTSQRASEAEERFRAGGGAVAAAAVAVVAAVAAVLAAEGGTLWRGVAA